MGTITIPSTPFTLPTTVLPPGGGVSQVNTGAGLTGGPITSTGVISLANTAVTPGSYSGANITVDQQGRLTAASNGSGGGGADPLFLTQGLSVNGSNPTIGGNASNRRLVDFTATYDQLNSDIGFTDQQGLSVTLNFNAGLNNYDSSHGGILTRAKYTPIALSASGTYYGAGEKFVLSTSGTFYSMGDSFTWTGATIYAGGPIGGDEGQGFTPFFPLTQPKELATGTITQVAKTGYSTTVTSNVTGSQNAQNVPVATTVGAVVGDWVILNQSVNSDTSTIWAMQILSINPGVSINGICAVNLLSGMTVTPALCMVLNSQGFEFGEQRVIVNLSGTSYSTGLVGSVTGAGFNGSGTTWTNTMVGGNALNIGVVYLDVDTLSIGDFAGYPWNSTPLKSYYQIIQVTSPTGIVIFSLSVADDQAYHGNGETNTNMTYKILPGARIMKWNPAGAIGTAWTLVCETSTHTWTVGDHIECAICPYPDVHGFDFRFNEMTAGGTRRYFMELMNYGARTFQAGLIIGGAPGALLNNTQTDFWACSNGIKIGNSETGIEIFDSGDNTTNFANAAIEIDGSVGGTHASDLGSRIVWGNWGSIGLMLATGGMDWVPTTDGVALFRFISPGHNVDTVQQQLVWNGYLQIAPPVGNPYLRFGGNTSPGSSIDDTFDILFDASGRKLDFIPNNFGNSPNLFSLTSNSVDVNTPGVATSNTTNQSSFLFRMNFNVWTGSSGAFEFAAWQAIPASGINNAPTTLQMQIWDNVNNNSSFPNLPFEVATGGKLKVGFCNLSFGGDKRITLDPVTNVTAAATVTFPNTGGDLLVAAANTTGAGSAALGANSPAVTNTAPYTWLRMISHDGSTVYVPAWK